MASELTINASLAFAKGNVASNSISLSSNTKFNVTGTRYAEGVQTIPTTAGGTTILLGPMVGTLGWFFFKNLDATNFIEIMTVISTGIVALKLKPGEIAMGRFGSGVTAPAAIADTASVQLQYLIVED